MKTFIPDSAKLEAQRQWLVVDATGWPLGRLASRVAMLLSGKRKPTWTPHLDTGDYVVVVNADKIILTGKKWEDKLYYSHSGYMGSLRSRTARQIASKHPAWLVYLAVKRMLPKNKLAYAMARRLKIYTGPAHPHAAQKPVEFNLKEFR